MHLKLTRSQRDGGVVSAKVIFCLDARIQLTAEEQADVNRYRLGNQVIYNSEASRRHLAAVEAHTATGTFGGAVKAWGSLALVALNLNITIAGLQRGQHIECKSLDELRSAEEAIMDACRTLKAYLDAAATFDGREVLLDFSEGEPRVVSQGPVLSKLVTSRPLSATEELTSSSPAEPVNFDAPEVRESPVLSGTNEQDRQPDFEPNWLENPIVSFGRFWERASPQRQGFMAAGAALLFIVLLRACS